MLIELDGVTKTYGKVTALSGLSVIIAGRVDRFARSQRGGQDDDDPQPAGSHHARRRSGHVLGMDIRT